MADGTIDLRGAAACIGCGEVLDVGDYHGDTSALHCTNCTTPTTATSVRGVSERRTWSSRTGRSTIARD